MLAGVRGYVLAGGRSARMGSDKGDLRLGGVTLLEIAVGKLRRMCEEVAVVGRRDAVPSGMRVIPDLRPGCGPLGGIETALRDAGESWAMFLPVDMPFVPVDLLEGMATEWVRSEARVCFAVVDGRAQPLVSLLRPEALHELQAALLHGEYRVRLALEAAGEAAGGVFRMEVSTSERNGVWPGWRPDKGEWAARELWFSNLNTPEEFALAEGFAGAQQRWPPVGAA